MRVGKATIKGVRRWMLVSKEIRETLEGERRGAAAEVRGKRANY